MSIKLRDSLVNVFVAPENRSLRDESAQHNGFRQVVLSPDLCAPRRSYRNVCKRARRRRRLMARVKRNRHAGHRRRAERSPPTRRQTIVIIIRLTSSSSSSAARCGSVKTFRHPQNPDACASHSQMSATLSPHRKRPDGVRRPHTTIIMTTSATATTSARAIRTLSF